MDLCARVCMALALMPCAWGAVTNSGGGFFAQYVAGGGWKTTLMLRSFRTAATPYRLEFRDPDGRTLDVELSGGRRGWFIEGVLPPRGAAFFESLQTGSAIVQGYVRVSSPDCPTDDRGSRCNPGIAGVSGAAVFQQNVPGRLPFEASVPLDSSDRTMSLFFDNSGGYTTSIAVLNPFIDAAGQVVHLRFRDEAGTVLYEQSMTVPSRSRTAVATTEWAPVTAGKRGTLSIESEGSGVAAFGLLFNSNGPFSTLLSVKDQ